MINEFVIPKDAFLTCFTPFIESSAKNNNQNVIAYSALLKKDITVDFSSLRKILDFMGITRIEIIYLNNPESINKEFIDNIIKFSNNNPSLNSTNTEYTSPYRFRAGNLEDYLLSVSLERINVFNREFNTQYCLFILNGYNWSDIVLGLKKELNIEISGGSTNKRHLLSHLALRLNAYLLAITCFRYDILGDSIVFDKVEKHKILPKMSFNKKNIVINNGK